MSLQVNDKSKAVRIDVRGEGTWWTRQVGAATLYPTGGSPVYSDVCQGQMGNCWFLSSLLAIALRHDGPAHLQGRMLDAGDEWVYAELWDGARKGHLMRARKQIVKQGAEGGGAAVDTESSKLWVSMFQVFAAAFMSNQADPSKVAFEPKNPSLTRLNAGWADAALAMLGGKPTNTGPVAGSYATLLAKHGAGMPIVVTSKTAADLQRMFPRGADAHAELNHTVVNGVVGGHAYAVWEIGTRQFGPAGVANPPIAAARLLNPWGQTIQVYSDAEHSATVDVAGQGDFWIPWAMLEKYFIDYYTADLPLGNPV